MAILCRYLMLGLVTISVPILCISGSIRFLAIRPEFYEWGQAQYVFVADPSPVQQRAADQALVKYFAGDPGSLQAHLKDYGLDEEFFSQRERLHLEDVHSLFQLAGSLAGATGIVMAVSLLVAITRLAPFDLPSFVRAVRRGAAATLIILATSATAALLDFRALFLQFHIMSFSNDLWQLDPAQHNLIRIFPFNFFLAAAVCAAVLAGAIAALFFCVATWWLRSK